jgi:hypothetical protein
LLQNENGPCPLLAAANCLLLKGSISLPSNCVGAGVVTIEDLVNVLGVKILLNQNGKTGSDHHIQEVMHIFPTLQFGMDVNPKFTAGPTGVEYTMHLNAFDLLHTELVHGWLLEPDAQEYELVGNQTYNQLVNLVIQGNDASTTLHENPQAPNHDELSTQATKGAIVKQFLDRSSHQLTQYGLTVLHDYLKEGQMVVFFRNNHFNTLTKHSDGFLYLLVTDFGYADVASVVWEKIDVIDGDTEYVTEDFKRPSPMERDQVGGAATGEQLVANNMQSHSDHQLALQLSRETSSSGPTTRMAPQKDADMEAARQASLLEHQQGATTTILPKQAASTVLPPHEATTTANSPPAAAAAASSNDNTNPPPAAAASNNSNSAPNVAVGIPAEPPSQEQQDMMLALKLQRQEEKEQEERRKEEDPSSRNLAVAMQRREKENQRRRVSRPGPPPRAQPTAPSGNVRSDGKCVIC